MNYYHNALTVLWMLVFASSAHAEQRYAFDVAERYQQEAVDIVDVPGVPDVKGVALKPSVPKFGWGVVEIGKTLPSGQYQIEYTISATGANAGAIALYAEGASGQAGHQQITRVRQCGAGQALTVREFFYAPEAFDKLAIKRMDDGTTPSVAISAVTLIDLGQPGDPRAEAYRLLMWYPAPWGLRSEKIAALAGAGTDPGAVEAWLDARGHAAELCCRAGYLELAGRMMKAAEGERMAVHGPMQRVREAVAEGAAVDFDEVEAKIDVLQAALDRELGGVVAPELGTDIFTWLKAWKLQYGLVGPEHAEPTPYRAVYGPATVRLVDPGSRLDLVSTWTASAYRSERMKIYYSILTPMVTVDLSDGPFEMTFLESSLDQVLTPGAAAQPLERGALANADKGWLALWSDKGGMLLVMNRRPTRAAWAGSVLTLAFEKSAAVGYVILPAAMKDRLADIAEFYQGLLRHQPAQCVQIQRGDRVEQRFTYIRRQSDFDVRPIKLTPVPPLLTLSLKPTSALRAQIKGEVSWSPDGWAYRDGQSPLEYVLPSRPMVRTFGANVSVENSTAELYRELAEQGCRTIRMPCGGFSEWDWSKVAEMRDLVRRNLEWARQAGGLTVGVDNHNWAPVSDFSSDQAFDEFVKRWTEIMSWCQDYQDVVGWYDLMNEPGIFHEHQPVAPYAVFMRKAVQRLRPAAGDKPILVEAVNMANPVGLEFWEDLGDENIIVGFHDYWPHQFTHQWVVEGGSPFMPRVFYPSFMPMIEWTSPSWRNDSESIHYWDRYKCDSISLPVYRLMIEKGPRMDCGEYGVVGYAGQASARSGVIWLRHALERFDRMRINHNVWSPSDATGYTWLVPEFREEVLRFWREHSRKTPTAATQPAE